MGQGIGGRGAPIPPWAGHCPSISPALTIQGFEWRFITEVWLIKSLATGAYLNPQPRAPPWRARGTGRESSGFLIRRGPPRSSGHCIRVSSSGVGRGL